MDTCCRENTITIGLRSRYPCHGAQVMGYAAAAARSRGDGWVVLDIVLCARVKSRQYQQLAVFDDSEPAHRLRLSYLL